MTKWKSGVCPKPICGSKRKRSRRRSRSRGIKKCYKPGVITRNPFLNFLRKYRREHCGKSIIQIAIEGARKWKSMSDEERCRYQQQAYCAPRAPRPRSRSRRRSRRHSRRRSRSKKIRMRSCKCKPKQGSRSRSRSHIRRRA